MNLNGYHHSFCKNKCTGSNPAEHDHDKIISSINKPKSPQTNVQKENDEAYRRILKTLDRKIQIYEEQVNIKQYRYW